jgi:hypothetical protein
MSPLRVDCGRPPRGPRTGASGGQETFGDAGTDGADREVAPKAEHAVAMVERRSSPRGRPSRGVGLHF